MELGAATMGGKMTELHVLAGMYFLEGVLKTSSAWLDKHRRLRHGAGPPRRPGRRPELGAAPGQQAAALRGRRSAQGPGAHAHGRGSAAPLRARPACNRPLAGVLHRSGATAGHGRGEDAVTRKPHPHPPGARRRGARGSMTMITGQLLAKGPALKAPPWAGSIPVWSTQDQARRGGRKPSTSPTSPIRGDHG